MRVQILAIAIHDGGCKMYSALEPAPLKLLILPVAIIRVLLLLSKCVLSLISY